MVKTVTVPAAVEVKPVPRVRTVVPAVRYEPPNLNTTEIPRKRPRSTYNIFVRSESVRIKEQYPHMGAPDIVRMAAKRFNEMSE